MKAVHTETSMAVYCYSSFGQLKLHNAHNVSYSNHCTKAVVLPAIVVEKYYKQQENRLITTVDGSADTDKIFNTFIEPIYSITDQLLLINYYKKNHLIQT